MADDPEVFFEHIGVNLGDAPTSQQLRTVADAIDGIVVADAADEQDDPDMGELDEADELERWMRTDEHEYLMGLIDALETANATHRAARAQRREEMREKLAREIANAEGILRALAPSVTPQEYKKALIVYRGLCDRWTTLEAVYLRLGAASTDEMPVLEYVPRTRGSLPPWALEAPSGDVLAALNVGQWTPPANNLVLIVLWMMRMKASDAPGFIRASKGKSRLTLKDVHIRTKAHRQAVANFPGLYLLTPGDAEDEEDDESYVGRAALQPTYKRLSGHASKPVNRKVRAKRAEVNWKKWTKAVLFELPPFWEDVEVPPLLFTKILEPIYIAFMETYRDSGLQYNVFDGVNWNAKASVVDVVRGLMHHIKLSHSFLPNGAVFRLQTPPGKYREWWEETYGAAFNHKLAPGSISRILTGHSRWRITSELPHAASSIWPKVPTQLYHNDGHPKTAEEVFSAKRKASSDPDRMGRYVPYFKKFKGVALPALPAQAPAGPSTGMRIHAQPSATIASQLRPVEQSTSHLARTVTDTSKYLGLAGLEDY